MSLRKIVAVVYDQHRLIRFRKILSYIAKSTDDCFCVVVNNNKSLDLSEFLRGLDKSAKGNLEVRSHDNGLLEFGAYQAGYDYIKPIDASDVLLINDTVGTHQIVTRKYLHRLCSVQSTPPLAVGHLDASEDRLIIGPESGHRWIRSSLIRIDAPLLKTLGGAISTPDVANYINGGVVEQEFFTSEVSTPLSNKLQQWLFATSGRRWYNAEPLSKQNSDKFSKKATSILQEMSLSFRLERAGAILSSPVLTKTDQRVQRLAKKLKLFV